MSESEQGNIERSQGPTWEVQGVSERQLVLVKQGHRYIFRFSPGQESKVLEGLLEMVRDPSNQLDWFDAAVLTHQMGQDMSRQLERLCREGRLGD